MAGVKYEIAVDASCCKFIVKECGKNQKIFFETVDSFDSNSVVLSSDSIKRKIFHKSHVAYTGDFYEYISALVEEQCSCSVDIDPVFEFVGITNHEYCRLSDQKKVVIRTCKLENGDLVITDTDSGSTITEAQLASDYDAECPKLVCVCTEMHYTLTEGQTIDYNGLLAHFEANGTFDDGSKAAEGINFVKFGNLSKAGFSFTYNGETRNNHAGGYNFGGTDFNDISNDLSITSNRGETTITYTVYKCN